MRTVEEAEGEEDTAGAAAGAVVTVEVVAEEAVTAEAAVEATKAEVEVTKVEVTATNRTHSTTFLNKKIDSQHSCIDVCLVKDADGVIVLPMSPL